MGNFYNELLFVIGAGAHVKYGLPTNAGLRDNILSHNSPVWPDRDNSDFQQKRHERFVYDFGRFGPSIDLFLQHREDWYQYGREAIARSILSLQHRSCRGCAQIDIYEYLFDLFLRGQLGHDGPIQIITFNYDTVIECRFAQMIASKEGIEIELATQKLSEFVKIHHVYGSLGLSVSRLLDDREIVPAEIVSAAKGISLIRQSSPTFADQTAEVELKIIRDLLRTSKTVFFLGFSFDKDNILKLGIQNYDDWGVVPGRFVCASGFGMTGDEKLQASRLLGIDLPNAYSSSIKWGGEHTECLRFLRENRTLLG